MIENGSLCIGMGLCHSRGMQAEDMFLRRFVSLRGPIRDYYPPDGIWKISSPQIVKDCNRNLFIPISPNTDIYTFALYKMASNIFLGKNHIIIRGDCQMYFHYKWMCRITRVPVKTWHPLRLRSCFWLRIFYYSFDCRGQIWRSASDADPLYIIVRADDNPSHLPSHNILSSIAVHVSHLPKQTPSL